ncbi:hypothetical protein BD414DRAFT_528207 [Trametes punicea]|nr:hypothetical protein BD414DRAFT_528207 [Trametes punicea]
MRMTAGGLPFLMLTHLLPSTEPEDDTTPHRSAMERFTADDVFHFERINSWGLCPPSNDDLGWPVDYVYPEISHHNCSAAASRKPIREHATVASLTFCVDQHTTTTTPPLIRYHRLNSPPTPAARAKPRRHPHIRDRTPDETWALANTGEECGKHTCALCPKRTFKRPWDRDRHVIFDHLGLIIQCEAPYHSRRVPWRLSRPDGATRHFASSKCMGKVYPTEHAQVARELLRLGRGRDGPADLDAPEVRKMVNQAMAQKFLTINLPCWKTDPERDAFRERVGSLKATQRRTVEELERLLAGKGRLVHNCTCCGVPEVRDSRLVRGAERCLEEGGSDVEADAEGKSDTGYESEDMVLLTSTSLNAAAPGSITRGRSGTFSAETPSTSGPSRLNRPLPSHEPIAEADSKIFSQQQTEAGDATGRESPDIPLSVLIRDRARLEAAKREAAIPTAPASVPLPFAPALSPAPDRPILARAHTPAFTSAPAPASGPSTSVDRPVGAPTNPLQSLIDIAAHIDAHLRPRSRPPSPEYLRIALAPSGIATATAEESIPSPFSLLRESFELEELPGQYMAGDGCAEGPPSI